MERRADGSRMTKSGDACCQAGDRQGTDCPLMPLIVGATADGGSPQLPPPWPFPIATETLPEANIPGVTSSRDAVSFRVSQPRLSTKCQLLYSLSRLSLVACAMSPCRPAGTKQVSNSVMPFGQEAIARDNIFYSALAGADRQQRHAPMTRRLSQTGAVRTFARSSRSAAATGSSIPSFRPNRMASSRMRAAISQIFRSAPGPNLFRKERAAA